MATSNGGSAPDTSPETLTHTIDNISISDFPTTASRRAALTSARALVRRLETPIDSLWDLSHNNPALLAALKVASANHIFTTLDADNGRAKTTVELCEASPCSPDPVLISRMLRHMGAMQFIGEAGPDLWTPTRVTRSLREEKVFAEVEVAGLFARALAALPDYLKETGYREPRTQGGGEGNFAYMLGTGESFFEYLGRDQRQQEIFSNFMSGYTSQRGSWIDVYPTENMLDANERRAGKADDDPTTPPLIVDMGGATGHDLGKFLQKHPQTAGRLAYQDQKHVVEDAVRRGLPPPGLKPMAHDFFTPQPIEDKESLQILENLKAAMRKPHNCSVKPTLLINDSIIPPTGANLYDTSIDVLMMALFGSKERSEDEWRRLLGRAGFKIVEVYRSAEAFEGVIECVVDDGEGNGEVDGGSGG
ncbi:MAG: hypothetical protein M1831_007303 [Alyxoria varia]|nr:MAG: hypothetical protein M1831_007303 [Alyxoria varia]